MTPKGTAMKAIASMPVAAACLLALVGCVRAPTGDARPTTRTTGRAAPAPVPSPGRAADEKACLDATARVTSAAVTLLRSYVSGTGREVMIGVGPNRVPWKCLVSKGVVSDVTSLTDEGSL